MDHFKIEEVLAMECKDKITYDEVSDILNKSGITAEEYNSYIAGMLGCPKQNKSNSMKTDLHVEEPMIKISEGYKIDGTELSKNIKKRLKDFYEIEMCPSFILHDSLLDKEDYKFLFEIYSDFYGLEHEYTEEMAVYVNEIINIYLKNILEKCGEDISVEKLRKFIKN